MQIKTLFQLGLVLYIFGVFIFLKIRAKKK